MIKPQGCFCKGEQKKERKKGEEYLFEKRAFCGLGRILCSQCKTLSLRIFGVFSDILHWRFDRCQRCFFQSVNGR